MPKIFREKSSPQLRPGMSWEEEKNCKIGRSIKNEALWLRTFSPTSPSVYDEIHFCPGAKKSDNGSRGDSRDLGTTPAYKRNQWWASIEHWNELRRLTHSRSFPLTPWTFDHGSGVITISVTWVGYVNDLDTGNEKDCRLKFWLYQTGPTS